MYVEFDAEKFGPYRPVAGPVPLHRHRAFKRGQAGERAGRIRALADQLDLPIIALAGGDVHLSSPAAAVSLPHQPFDSEAHAYHFAGAIAATLAVGRGVADAVFAAQLRHWTPTLGLLEDGDDLAVGKAGRLHVELSVRK